MVDDNSESSKSPRDIEKSTGISRTSVRWVVGLDEGQNVHLLGQPLPTIFLNNLLTY